VSHAITVVEGLDSVVSLAAGHVPRTDLDVARTLADAARSRTGYLGTTMVLALVGGTGAGKSSLLNALAGEPIASTSVVRPHTTEPTAWIPSRPEPSLHLLLNRLGVDQRVSHDRLTDLAVLDMTDIDSVVVEHRELVERLMPEVDVVVWVFDPVKYADPVLHREFIVPLANSSDRLIFVLNKIDLLDRAALDGVLEHVGRLLAEDGIAEPVVFGTAAEPPDGDSRGIEALTAHLATRLDEKRVHVGKIIDDVRRVARDIAGAAGVVEGGSLGFEERWLFVREAIVTDFDTGGAAAFEEPLRLVENFILKLSTEAGGAFGQRIRQFFDIESIEAGLAAAFEAAAGSSDPSRTLDDQIQQRFGGPLRKLLWERASLVAVVAGLAVDAATAGKAIGRVPA